MRQQDKSTRRGFLSAGAGGVWALAAGAAALPAAQRSREGDRVSCLDYGRSFLCNPKSFNAVRFWIESRTILYDDERQKTVEFYQCASCKSENTFAERDLFQEDNYDFLPIFGGEDLLVFRRHARLTSTYRTTYKAEDVWGKPLLKLRRGSPVRVLETFEDIRRATAAGIPLVTRTELRDAKTGLRATIECPTKTMNVSLDKSLYQVDTGPIALPDLTKRYERPIESLHLAFVAFNAPDFADFVVEQPTAASAAADDDCKVYHYSGPRSLAARNTVLAVGEA